MWFARRQLIVCLMLIALGVGFGLKTLLADGIPSPTPLYYSGTLTEGGQLVNGTRAITVNLWPDGTTQGSPLCTTVASTANVTSGRFRIALASSCKGIVNQSNGLYLEVIDGATSLGRSPVGAVPYAVEADHAVSATNATNATSATSAAYAADAGHASTADNAINAANATTATNATNAAHASTADNATTATNATNALSTVGGSEINANNGGSYGAACIANFSNANTQSVPLACTLAANRQCVSEGYKSGWFVGEWGSSSDGSTHTIACIK